MHQALSGADHLPAHDRRAADHQAQDRLDVCRVIEVTQPTYHRLSQHYWGMQADEARRLTQLEKENAPLKKLLSKVALEKAILKPQASANHRDLAKGTSEPGTPLQGRHCSAGSLPGFRTLCLPGSGSAPQHPEPCWQGCRHLGAKAPPSTAGDPGPTHLLGP